MPPLSDRPARPRCAVGARARDDDVVATAPPARRILALEVPGPWGPDALTSAGLPEAPAARLRAAADSHGVRVVLVRRPGRHPRDDGPHAWLLADVASAALAVGRWSRPDDLAGLDVGAPLPPWDGPPVALVCTHGRHDVCCAVDGRPVAAALAADPRVTTWECSHLGGDRFAANVLLLPSGDLAGRVGVDDVPRLVDAVLDGRVLTGHHRGRCGQAPALQAAHTLALRALGEDRPQALVVERVRRVPEQQDRWDVVVRHEGRTTAFALRAVAGPPERLTCSARADSRAWQWRLDPVA